MKVCLKLSYLVLLVCSLLACNEIVSLKAQGSIGKFDLMSHKNMNFNEQKLNDKVWVSDFIFTSCKTVCPKLTTQMQWIQDQVKDQSKETTFISFSVDPDRDTPSVLSEYVKSFKIKDHNWVFLTGDIDSVKTVVVKNLKQAMGKDPQSPQNILHGSHFILGKGSNIYGYYKSNKAGLNQLVSAIRSLN